MDSQPVYMVGGGKLYANFKLNTTTKSVYYVNNYAPYQVHFWEGLEQQLYCTACVEEINYYKLMVISSR